MSKLIHLFPVFSASFAFGVGYIFGSSPPTKFVEWLICVLLMFSSVVFSPLYRAVRNP